MVDKFGKKLKASNVHMKNYDSSATRNPNAQEKRGTKRELTHLKEHFAEFERCA
jgi:hypothetical protein